ncbi:MAG: hypothetical protein ABSD80_11695 [Caulobacteraceae bacterium]|jgi:hypothetical protein
MPIIKHWRATAAGLSALLSPSIAAACACGCGVFDVGGGSFMPQTMGSGFTAWFRYDYMDQNQNWESDHSAPAADNDDKLIRTHFFTVGGQYTINGKWSVMAELPFYDRTFRTTDDDGSVFGHAGAIYQVHLNAPGDLQVMGMYTGFASDRSTGLGLGLKLPTGVWHSPVGPFGGDEFDRDSLPGTGTTDAMIQGYHLGSFDKAKRFNWFVQAKYDIPFSARAGYRPGNELDAAAGVTYDLGKKGVFDAIAPMLQLVNSYRIHDTGPQADELNSGYERLLISPGFEVRVKRVRLYADVELPIYQHTNAAPSVAIEGASGQLVAPTLVKVSLAYDF